LVKTVKSEPIEVVTISSPRVGSSSVGIATLSGLVETARRFEGSASTKKLCEF